MSNNTVIKIVVRMKFVKLIVTARKKLSDSMDENIFDTNIGLE